MNKNEEEKLKREVKQIGIDVVIGLIILSLTFGFTPGAITN